MACSLSHTDSEVEALVQKLIDEDKGRQNAILDLALQFENSCTAKDDLRKAYENVEVISQRKLKDLRYFRCAYYNKCNNMWRQFDSLVDLPACTCDDASKLKDHTRLLRLIQFLMGLDDTYGLVRSLILTNEPLPDVKYLPGIKRKGNNQSVNNVNTNKVDQSKGITHTFTGDQYRRLMNLLSGPSECSHVQPNVSNFEGVIGSSNVVISFMTCSVLDVKHLNITVEHPNGTVAHPNRTVAHVMQIGHYKILETLIIKDALVVYGYYSSESNDDLRESNKGISDSEDSGSKSQRPNVVPNDKAVGDLDASFIQQNAATFDEGYSTPIKENTFIQQESSTLGGSRTYYLGGISTSEDISDNVNPLSDDLDNMFEDEDFGLFGNIFESTKFAESETLTNERDSQSNLLRRSSRKTTLPRKLGDYVLYKKVKNSIDKSVNYAHLSKDNFVFSTSLNKIIEPKTYLEVANAHRWVEAMNQELEALSRNCNTPKQGRSGIRV
ncbi:hypothetical protein Tco_0981672 [Tanacetum coccineum]